MSDPAFTWLTQQLARTSRTEGSSHTKRNYLWLLDENAGDEWRSLSPNPQVQVISNRWDLAHAMSAAGWQAQFSDFDFNQLADNSLDGIFYRVSKEKALVNHLLNQSWRCLKPAAPLWLCGQKNEGIKTWLDKTCELFGCAKQGQKNGMAYVGQLHKQRPFAASEQLDDSHYTQLRAIEIPGTPTAIYSKPGQFGWNKADQGSALLISELGKHLQQRLLHARHCLDLGCGYGYLSLQASRLPECASIKHWTLTDNNAAALASARHNTQAWGINAEVIGDNCAAHIQGEFDLLLCNPPFHQGFDVEGELTDRFIASAKRLLSKTGVAIFVVNQFIPLEKKAADHFRHCQLLCNNGRFKLLALSH